MSVSHSPRRVELLDSQLVLLLFSSTPALSYPQTFDSDSRMSIILSLALVPKMRAKMGDALKCSLATPQKLGTILWGGVYSLQVLHT